MRRAVLRRDVHPKLCTRQGRGALAQFTQIVAGIAPDWNMKAFRAEAVRRIREQVGKGRVVCGLSGAWIPRLPRF